MSEERQATREAERERAKAERQAARLAERVKAREARADGGTQERPAGAQLAEIPQAEAPLPPAELIRRATGVADPFWFEQSGALLLADWRRALTAAGRDFSDFKRIVDLGSESGRVLRHLRGKLGRDRTMLGVDADPEALAWMRENLEVEGHPLTPLPPTPFARISVDLVLSFDVFARLDEAAQLAWLEEIHRILLPRGVLVVALNGRTAWDEHRRRQPGGEDDLDASGFAHLAGNAAASFHAIDYVERVWARWFRIRAWLPVAVLAQRDAVVLEKAAG